MVALSGPPRDEWALGQWPTFSNGKSGPGSGSGSGSSVLKRAQYYMKQWETFPDDVLIFK